MEYYLFLDDERFPYDVTWLRLPVYPWIIVRNFDEFKQIIEKNGIPNFISFDHDLADFHYEAMLREVNGETDVDYGPEKTGYDCAKWLAQYCMDTQQPIPNYTVHSLNPIGRANIQNYLENSKRFI